MNDFRKKLKDKKRIVIKIGSSSLTHENTGELNLFKIEKLIRVICDLKGEGKDVVLVSSGAMAAGRQVVVWVRSREFLQGSFYQKELVPAALF